MYLLKFRFKKFVSITFLLIFAVGSSFAQTTALSPKDRAEVFETVWKKINKKYYSADLNGVNWNAVHEKYQPPAKAAQSDAEFYAVVKQMVNEMRDAHTRFLTPREASEYRNKQGTGVGILLGEVENQSVVLYVAPNSEAERAGVKAGMTVKTVDGRSVADKLPEIYQSIGDSSSDRAEKILAYRRLLEGEPETPVKIGLTDENGVDSEVVLTRKTTAQDPKAAARKLASGIGYISLNTFRGNAFEVFKKELASIKDAPGIIVDLRLNGGGSIVEVLKIAGLFEKSGTPFGNMINRSQKSVAIAAISENQPMSGAPLVILLSQFSASGSELFAGGLQEAGRAKIVGSQSCGCLLGIREEREMKGGSLLHLSEIGFLSAHNKIYEKVGITPDAAVVQSIKNLQNSDDEEIIEAEKILTGK